MERAIRKEVIVDAPVSEVWQAWTTEDGAVAFFAPEAKVELAMGGRYEMLFNLSAPPGSQGGEGLRFLSYLPEEMLSFEWNAPPEYANVRPRKTWVVVQLEALRSSGTRVRLTHLGWQEGQEWDQVFDYFEAAWDIVLGRLQYRFAVGPVDWADPYGPAT